MSYGLFRFFVALVCLIFAWIRPREKRADGMILILSSLVIASAFLEGS